MRCHTLDMKNSCRAAAHRRHGAPCSRCFPDVRCSAMARSGEAKRDADEGRDAVPALPEPVPTHRFEIDATTDIVGVVQKTTRHQGRHAHRHRAPLQRGLRRNRARQSGRRSVAAGREPRDRHSLAVHPAERAARGHRHQRRRDASLLLPEGEEGRAAGGAHLSHRHRQGGLEDARRRDQDRAPAEGSRPGARRRPSSRSIARSAARSSSRWSGPARTIRSAASRSTSAGPRT